MKIALINGSPKINESVSGLIINALKDKLGSANDCHICSTAKDNNQKVIETMSGCNALVFVFPLYVDGIPSHLLRLLDEARADIADAAPNAIVYAVVNNGFYEARQNTIALKIMRNFCARSELKWGQGLKVGAGGMTFAAPIGHGPMKNLGKALDVLAGNITNGRTAEDYICEPNFPKALYRIAGGFSWKMQARKNGLKIRDLYNKNL
jgi:multimeric flavodoxin WrbA